MLWLVYQFISAVGVDNYKLKSSDLPPAIIDINESSGKFAFDYRSIYSPANSNPEMFPITATSNIDYDWGIWGHNLHKVLGKNPDKRVFAVVNGEIDYEQYCFTSASLFKAVENYIYDNYGNGNNDSGSRFAIFPADNSIVCL